ncbi:MAG: hypothetical protein NUW14_03915 [Deltaproteobacteria bacterium]|nr:hypothetical protein [Deltaproteobacteria bacterium]
MSEPTPHRDEKTVLGVVEAQVCTPTAVETVPCFVVAAYASCCWRPRKPVPPGSVFRRRSGAEGHRESGTPRLA